MGAARQRAAKLQHGEVREGAVELIFANLIEEIRLRRCRLVKETRNAAHRLKHCKVRTMHSSGTMTCEPSNVSGADWFPRRTFGGEDVAPVREGQRQHPARLKLRWRQGFATNAVRTSQQRDCRIPESSNRLLSET